MATQFTHTFTAANGQPWPDFTRVAGASLANEVQSNVGWNGATAGERFFQSDFWPASRDYKWDLDVDFANATGSGRYFGMAARLTDDGQTCYWWKISSHRISDTTLNMPHAILYRRRSGTDTEIKAETNISGTITGADLNAGVTFRMRIENTDEDTVNIKLYADDGGGMTELVSHNDTAGARIESGGTIGIVTGSVATDDDITYDNASVIDFADEATGGAPPSTGLVLFRNGSYLTEDEAVSAGLTDFRTLRSYAIAPSGSLADLNDYHNPALNAGDDIGIIYNDVWYARGVIRNTSHVGALPEVNTYEIHGPKMLASSIAIEDPTTKVGQIYFNVADEDDEQYDSAKTNMAPGHILQWIFDNHLEGQDGLRALGAAPPSGTAYSVPAAMMSGAVIPGVTLSGSVAEAIETVLSYMPQYAWDVDPETKVHSFIDRSASSSEDVAAEDNHTFIRIDKRTDQNRTVVKIRGAAPEITMEEVSLAQGTLEGAWDSARESTYTPDKGQRNRIEGTLSAYGAYSGDPTYGDRLYVDPDQTGGKFAMDADEWNNTFITITMTTHGSKTFQIYKNTTSRLILTSTAWPGGGSQTPTVTDPIAVFGTRERTNTVEGDVDGANNGYYESYRVFSRQDGKDFVDGACFTATMKTPLAGGNEDVYNIEDLGGRIVNGVFILDQPGLLPTGLINYLPGRDGGCGEGKSQGVGQGGLGDFTINAPVAETEVPTVRWPDPGFWGTAYAADSGKWSGGGEPSAGDPGVKDPLIIDDPNFQYQAQQQADYQALAQDLLKVYGTLAVNAEITFTNSIAEAFNALNKKVTISDSTRTTGYESSPDIWVMEVEYDFRNWETIVRCGTQSSFGGVNVQSVRTRFVENQRIKNFREMLRRAMEMVNCLKSLSPQSSAGAGIPSSSKICASQVTTSTGKTVEEEITHDKEMGAVPPAVASLACDAAVCDLYGEKQNALDAATSIISKQAVLDQPTNRTALAAGEAYIEDVVSCLQEHVAALWINLHDFVTTVETLGDKTNECFQKMETNDAYLCTQLLALQTNVASSFGNTQPGPGVSFSTITCVVPQSCLGVCECSQDFKAPACTL